MTTLTRRTPPASATGTCRWLKPFDGTSGRLRVTVVNGRGKEITTEYDLFRDGACWLLATDDDKVYTVDTSFGGGVWVCDCPDASYRRGSEGCKHCRALASALANLYGG